MRALSKRDSMYSVGNQIGVGKESGALYNVSESGLADAVMQTFILSPTRREMRWCLSFIGEFSPHGVNGCVRQGVI